MSTPCPKRAVVKRLAVNGHRVRLRVAVPQAGRLRVSGSGLASVTRRVARARLVSFTLHLTRRGGLRLARQGKLRMRLMIRYTPKGWPTQTIVTRKVTIRR